MDAKTRRDLAAVLKRAEAELSRNQKVVDSLKALLTEAAPARRARVRRKVAAKPKAAAKAKTAAPKPKAAPKRKAPANGRRRRTGGHPNVSAGHYAGLGVTKAYRKFVAEFGTEKYSVPQVRDALLQGGVKASSPASLLTGLHGVRRRDRLAAAAAGRGATKRQGKGRR